MKKILSIILFAKIKNILAIIGIDNLFIAFLPNLGYTGIRNHIDRRLCLMKNIVKILTALAAIAGVIYVIAAYGERIVAWAKKPADPSAWQV